MNNLSLYCGLVDAKIRASDKDLPVKLVKSHKAFSWEKLMDSDLVCFFGDGIDEDIVWDLSTFENMPVCPENQDCFHTLRVWTEGCQNVNIT